MRNHKPNLRFEVSQRPNFLSEDGAWIQPEGADFADKPFCLRAYRAMRLGRLFDNKAIALQRTGKIGTYPSIAGHEAISAAIGLALYESDIFVPYYRDCVTQWLRGVHLHEILQYWGGDERGNHFQACRADFPNCVPIATQLCHAAGAAVRCKYDKLAHAVLATCGDGATSKGDFYESLNLAGTWHLPLVVVVHNNQWAISTPRSAQTCTTSIAQKAIAAGIAGERVDGNDLFAVYHAVKTALHRARQNKGATLIEATCYRLGDHTTADDASRYRDANDLNAAWQCEPLVRFQRFMEREFAWNDSDQLSLDEELEGVINEAVSTYLALAPEPVTAMFDHLYERMPSSLQQQRAEVALRKRLSGGVAP